ncbi:F0F1 ATP synthase subunit A [Candidatus Daviesbacteria bacterium]|nr:F0F1 ATP synthase subunit A [Candidatus Daviesbacteria bacterium]
MENEIVLKPEIIGQIGSLPLTNTLLVTWITMGFLVILSFLATRRIQKVPSGIQNFFEMVVELGFQTVEDLAHSKTAVIFPIVMTFFLLIVMGNLLGLLPGFSTISFNGAPLLRSMNSDLNTTLALALVSAAATHILAVKYLGIKNYLIRWVSLNPIFLFVGMLEIVSEFTKIMSLSFRLFGNIFAGEVVLATISNIAAFLLPLPFYFLEIIVGFVQAAVFMMLTLVFMVLLSEKHESH